MIYKSVINDLNINPIYDKISYEAVTERFCFYFFLSCELFTVRWHILARDTIQSSHFTDWKLNLKPQFVIGSVLSMCEQISLALALYIIIFNNRKFNLNFLD